MDVVIDYESSYGAHGEEVLKDVSVAAKNVQETCSFLPPNCMEPHGLRVKIGGD
jgi:hypothetical protein